MGDDTLSDETPRTVLITGGNRGIGLATAGRFADAGHRVAVTYRTQAPPDDRLLAVPCDVTDVTQIETAFGTVEEALGPVEVLVANAGITRDGLVLRMSDDAFTEVLEANLTGAFRTCRRAAKSMVRQRWGRMVLVSSVVGIGGQAGQANYAASKAGLLGLGRSLARELASRNITVNMVAPGPVATDMIDALSDTQRQAITDVVPLGRVGQPSEVAATIAFLASDDAGYITGAVVPIDGGLAMGA